MRSLLAWWRSWRLSWRVRTGKQTWGRQPDQVAQVYWWGKWWRLERWVKRRKKGQPAGHMHVPMEGRATISARVYRKATDTWEDLGVISEPGKE